MDITLTLKCNNNCVFCPRGKYLKTIACGSLKDIYRDIKKTRKQGDKIALSGGEVTLLPGLGEMAAFCKSLGFKSVGIITNARLLKDIKLAEKLVLSGVTDFAVSLYSFNNKVHDTVTRRKESARETKKGLVNLLRLAKRYPVSIRVNTVLNTWNLHDIPATLKALYSRGVRNFIVAEQMVIDKGSRHLSAKQIREALATLRELKMKDARLVLRGFPFCLLGCDGVLSAEGIIIRSKDPFILLEKQEVDTLVKSGASKTRYLSDFSRLFTRIASCRSCHLKSKCQGIQKAYIKKC